MAVAARSVVRIGAAIVTVAALALPAGAVAQRRAASAGPTSTAGPTVGGIARAGHQLVANHGTWAGSGTLQYAYQWSRCDAAGNSCTPVQGATAATYTLAAADVGKTLGLALTVTDASGAAQATASLVGPIAAATTGLASTVRPSIVGVASVGSPLVVSSGAWTVTPASLSYAWQRCDATGRACVAIAGATSATYTPTVADLGRALVVRVQATAGSGTQPVLSLATAAVGGAAGGGTPTQTPAAGSRPTVAGVAKVGQRLTGTAPASAVTGATVAYQWYRCDAMGAHCSSIHGATGAGYKLVQADGGKTIGLTVRVTVNGTATPTYASLVGPVAAASAPAASTVQPAVTGKAVQGQVLTASAGTWTTAPTAVTYAWQRCNANGRICVAIAGAASATYTAAAADVGHALVAVVTATIGGATQTALSTATDAVAAPPALGATAPPTVAGTAKVGQQLTGGTGTWTGTAPISYANQWYRCDATGAHCSSVRGATAPTYRLGAKDGGHTVGLTVKATDATGSKSAYSALVGPIVAASASLATIVQPAVTGTAAVGKTLTVSPGTWTATTSGATYQWERCNANGRACVAIAGATASSYVVAAADVGHALLAIVQATAGSATGTAFSTATAAAVVS